MDKLNWAADEIRRARGEVNKSLQTDGQKMVLNKVLDSVFDAFDIILLNGHTDDTISEVRVGLDRLVEGLPLSPITDNPNDWVFVDANNGVEDYICKRMESLHMFIDYDDKGKRVTYSDYNRAVVRYPSGEEINHVVATYIADLMDPIKLPYMPELRKYVCSGIAFDKSANIWSVTRPNGEVIDTHDQFWTMNDDSHWVRSVKE